MYICLSFNKILAFESKSLHPRGFWVKNENCKLFFFTKTHVTKKLYY